MKIFSDKKIVEKMKSDILCSIAIFFPENRAVYVEKYCAAWQATDDNMAHAHFMLVI